MPRVDAATAATTNGCGAGNAMFRTSRSGSPIDTRQYNASYVSQTRDAFDATTASTNQQVATQVIPVHHLLRPPLKHHHETLMKDKPGNTKESRMKGASKENTKPTTDAAATATIKEDEILAKNVSFDWLLGADSEARFKIHTKNPERIYRKVSTSYLTRYSTITCYNFSVRRQLSCLGKVHL